jgi:ligand-binding sensor domain-containing protein
MKISTNYSPKTMLMSSKSILFILFICIPFFMFSQGEWVVYSKEKLNAGNLKSGNYTRNFCEDNAGNIWVSTSKGGILKYSNNTWDLFDVQKISFLFGQSNAANIINAKTGTTCDWYTALDKNGKWVWFGASKGVVLWDGSQMIEMTGKTNSEGRMIFHSVEKDEYYFIKDKKLIKTKSVDNKEPVIQIGAILIDSKNRLWAANWQGMVYCLENGIWKSYGEINRAKFDNKVKFREHRIYKMIEDHKGAIWVMFNNGIAKFDENNLKIVKEFQYPKAIFEDSKNNIWIGHESGIDKFDGSNWKSYERDEDKGMKFIMNEAKFTEDKDGNLWFSSRTDFGSRKGGGLYVLEGDEWKDMKCEKYHTNIHSAKDGTLWCTGMRGIYKYENGTFKKVRQSEGFATFYFEMFEDSKGNIWFGCSTVGGHIEKYSPH